MASQTRTLIILNLLLIVSLAARWGLAGRTVHLAPGYTLDRIPAQLAGTPGVDLPLSSFEVALLAPDGGQILQRRYHPGDNIIWLAAVQSRTDWRVQHPPQICYTAQGWRLDDERRYTLPGCTVRRMAVSKGAEHRLVYYFYTDGRHWTSSYFIRILYALLDRAWHAQVSTWALIQISTPWQTDADEARLARAMGELFPHDS